MNVVEPPVLLIDDDEKMLSSYRILLKSAGLGQITLCSRSTEVMELLAAHSFDCIIMDLMMPEVPGEELLERIAPEYPNIPVIIITALDATETVVRCMRKGAFDFIVKPVDKNRFITSVQRALQYKKLERERDSLKQILFSQKLEHPAAFAAFNTVNERMKSIFRYMERIALSTEPVLITGETGSGKELAAQALARLSAPNRAFVTVNVAGLDDALLADTLFGHLKGAFTDAFSPRKGLVEQAENGMLFLDEIGDLSPVSQIKLLRLLQEHEYYPIGSDMPRRSQARIIAATNKNPEELQKSGAFRKDLYYRLCVHHIHLPPLRERREDIPLLTDYFLNLAATDLKKPTPTAPPELYTLLSSYHFPGNIRELRAMIYHAVSMHSSRKLSLNSFREAIEQSRQLNRTPSAPPQSEPVSAPFFFQFPELLPTLKEIQEILVKEALRRSKNNQAIAAQMLGVTRQALNKRIRDMNGRDAQS